MFVQSFHGNIGARLPLPHHEHERYSFGDLWSITTEGRWDILLESRQCNSFVKDIFYKLRFISITLILIYIYKKYNKITLLELHFVLKLNDLNKGMVEIRENTYYLTWREHIVQHWQIQSYHMYHEYAFSSVENWVSHMYVQQLYIIAYWFFKWHDACLFWQSHDFTSEIKAVTLYKTHTCASTVRSCGPKVENGHSRNYLISKSISNVIYWPNEQYDISNIIHIIETYFHCFSEIPVDTTSYKSWCCNIT